MKSRVSVLLASASLLLFSASLNAGIHLACESPDESDQHRHQFDYSEIDTGHLGIQEQLQSTSQDRIHFNGTCDQYSVIDITKTVTNGTVDDTWTSYILTLGNIIIGDNNGNGGCDAEFVLENTITSNVFQNITLLEPHKIIFEAPDSVLPGDSVTFEFSIRVSSEDFHFCLNQTPVPEPLTLALFGIGALCIRMKK